MKILLGYATYSSGTYMASQVVKDFLAVDCDVIVEDIRKVTPEMFHSFDLIILASPSWWNRKSDGMPHEFMLSFMDTMQGVTFPQKPFAIFGLGDTAYPNFCGAVAHLEEFVAKLEGKLLIPSLRIDGYYFDQEENEKRLQDWSQSLLHAISSSGV